MSSGSFCELIWCLVVMTALIGWGVFVELVFNGRRREFDVGLLGLFGASWTLAFFGAWMAVIGGPLVHPLAAWLILGVGGFFLRYAKIPYFRERPPLVRALVALVLASVALQVLSAAAHPIFNAFDDALAYLPHAKMILTLGEAVDPFSLRRASSFGGQALLDAFMLLGLEPRQAGLLESGVFLPLLMLLLWNWSPRRGGIAQGKRPFCRGVVFWPAVMFLVAWHEYPRINLASQLTGAYFFVGLIRVVDRPEASSGSALMRGLVLAALSTLRAPFLVFGITYVFLHAAIDRSAGCGRIVHRLASILWALLLLAPWSWLLLRSSGTPFYPFVVGNGVGFAESAQWLDPSSGPIEHFFRNLWHSGVLLAFPIALAWWFRRRIPEWASVGAALGTACAAVVIISLRLPDFPVSENFRYYHPFLLGSALAFLRCFTENEMIGRLWSSRRRFATLLLIGGLAWSLELIGFFPFPAIGAAIEDMSAGRSESPKILAAEAGLRDRAASAYRVAQAAVPPGEPLLSATDQPFLFDYTRNPVRHLDIPGAAAPGGVRLEFRDEVPTERQLLALGIRYLIFTDPKRSQSLYSRNKWTYGSGKFPKDFHKAWLPHFSDFIHYLEKKEGSPQVIAQTENLYVVDLKK